MSLLSGLLPTVLVVLLLALQSTAFKKSHIVDRLLKRDGFALDKLFDFHFPLQTFSKRVNQSSISYIQSPYYRSPYEDAVFAVEGVITHILGNRLPNSGGTGLSFRRYGNATYSENANSLWIQTPTASWDDQERTSEAIVVRLGPDSNPLYKEVQTFRAGDSIRVVGKVSEFRRFDNHLSQTELTNVREISFVKRAGTAASSLDQLLQQLVDSDVLPVPINECMEVVGSAAKAKKVTKKNSRHKRLCYTQPNTRVFGPAPFARGSVNEHVDIEPGRNRAHGAQVNTFGPLIEPSKRGIDFFKSLEHMLVKIEEPLVLSKTTRQGSFWVVSHRGKYATNVAPNGPAVFVNRELSGPWGRGIELDSQPERIQVMPVPYSKKKDINPGDVLSTLYGVVVYSAGNYQVNLLHDYSIIAKAPKPAEILSPKVSSPSSGTLTFDKVFGKRQCRPLKIVSYNVQNLNGLMRERIRLLGSQIAYQLGLPDIVALQEVQDNKGPKFDQEFRANETMSQIVDAIFEFSGVRYSYAQIDPSNPNSDGGQPNGNIRPAYLYNPEYVQLAESIYDRQGGPTEDTIPIANFEMNTVDLTVNPGRVFPRHMAFEHGRKPLLAAFNLLNGVYVKNSARNQKLYVINCHFSSKMYSSPLYGSTQLPINAGETKREIQVKVVSKFVFRLQQDHRRVGLPDPNVLVVGDMNEMEFVDALEFFEVKDEDEGAGLVELAKKMLSPVERYTYIHDGAGMMLDHFYASPAVASRAKEYKILHLNTHYKYVETDQSCESQEFATQGTASESAKGSLFPELIQSALKRARVGRTAPYITDSLTQGAGIFEFAVDEAEPKSARRAPLDYESSLNRAAGVSRKRGRKLSSFPETVTLTSPFARDTQPQLAWSTKKYFKRNLQMQSFDSFERTESESPRLGPKLQEVLSDHDPVIVTFNFC